MKTLILYRCIIVGVTFLLVLFLGIPVHAAATIEGECSEKFSVSDIDDVSVTRISDEPVADEVVVVLKDICVWAVEMFEASAENIAERLNNDKKIDFSVLLTVDDITPVLNIASQAVSSPVTVTVIPAETDIAEHSDTEAERVEQSSDLHTLLQQLITLLTQQLTLLQAELGR